MSRGVIGIKSRKICFPRVSGDEPGLIAVILAGAGFSPRERG